MGSTLDFTECDGKLSRAVGRRAAFSEGHGSCFLEKNVKRSKDGNRRNSTGAAAMRAEAVGRSCIHSEARAVRELVDPRGLREGELGPTGRGSPEVGEVVRRTDLGGKGYLFFLFNSFLFYYFLIDTSMVHILGLQSDDSIHAYIM